MSQYRSPFAAYRSAAESTVSKPRIVQLLLDGAVSSIQKSVEAFELDDIGARLQTIHNQATKAGAIVAQLRDALDLETGGEFARRLFGLYGYVSHKLVEGNIKKDTAPLLEAQRHLRVIQEAWREMLAGSSPSLSGACPEQSDSRPTGSPSTKTGFSIQV